MTTSHPDGPAAADPVRRRTVLTAIATAPVAALATRAAGALVGAVPFLRPNGRGTSATRCAQCGSDDHTMLDPACPATRTVI